MKLPTFVANHQQQNAEKPKRGFKPGKKLKMVETIYCALPADQGGEETFLGMAACAGIREEKAREAYQLAFRLSKRGK